MSTRIWILTAFLALGGCDATTPPAAAADAEDFPDDAEGNWERIALYIGINDYKHDKIGDLSGCVNDARRVRKALRAHGFLRSAILTDENATRENIKAYAEALIAQVKTAHASGVKEPLVAIFYAGHGNKVRGGDIKDKEKAPGDNTFTTHDTDPSGSRDIRDDDIYRLITRLQSKDHNATVVFFADACHSASSFRASPTFPVRSVHRGDTDFHLRKGPDRVFPWDPDKDVRHAYYGACGDSDVAGETEVNGTRTGKFTQVLVELLESGRPIESYEDLGFAIQQQFALTFPGSKQRPAFHITREMKKRRFLLQERALRHARVEKQTGSTTVVITAGSIHGVDKGSRIDFYKDLTDLREMGEAAILVSGRVASVDAGSAIVRLAKANKLPKGAVARVHQPSVPSFRLHIGKNVPDPLRKKIEALAENGQVSLAEDDGTFAYELVFDAQRKCLALHAPDNLPTKDQPADPFVRIFPEDPKVDMGEVLLRLGQQHLLFQLKSNEDLLAIEIVEEDSDTPIKVDPATGIASFKSGAAARLRIRNLSPKKSLYVAVLLAERERAPKGEKPGEGQRRIFGAVVEAKEHALAPGEVDYVDLPEIRSEWHPRPSRIHLKVIATDRAYDFERFEGIVTTPYMGEEATTRGDDEDDVMNFLEDVSHGKRGITPKRLWATGTVVLDTTE